MTCLRTVALPVVLIVSWSACAAVAGAQPPAAPPVGAAAPQAGRARPPAVVSPQVEADRRVTFRIYAPGASAVTLSASDIPAPAPAAGQGAPAGPSFVKGENGIWEAAVGPVPPGAFRYVFQVDGVNTLDPVNVAVSGSNANNWSLFFVPGIEDEEARNVPHGAVASIYYYSAVLGTMRRLHVYTPPGYEEGKRKYPVFYLLHGAGDCDDAWTSVGRAGFILDNLIAAGRAVPMIVVMPAGHQPTPAGPTPAPPPPAAPAPPAVNPFTREFVGDIMPLVERRYRTLTDRSHRAIAGLSMGGSQTLDIAFRNLARFGYIGVFSSGATLGGGRGATSGTAAARPDWETVHRGDLDAGALKKGTRLVWLATGTDDRLMPNTQATVDLLKKHGFSPVFKQTAGGHTWLNWRDYLRAFAPLLFR